MAKEIHITPAKTISRQDLVDLYNYRELLGTLVWKDIKVKYKQTIIGVVWAVLRPLVTMIVFSIFFGSLAQLPSEGVPYPIFSYSGLLIWTYFSNALSNASNSLVSNAGLISKVYFPRIIAPLAATLVEAVDYLVAFTILLGLMVYFQIPLTINLLWLPAIFLCTWVLVSGLGMWMAAINVKYRDVRYALPFFIQMLIFVTPVIYPTSIADQYQWLLKLNPMTGLVEAHRIAILNHQPLDVQAVIISLLITSVIFISGWYYFKSVEKYFADII